MMNRVYVTLVVLCCALLHGTNLLKEPLTLSNPETTVFSNGVYTVTNPDVDTVSTIYQDVVLNQSKVECLTFAVEAMAEENVGDTGCHFGLALDLVFTDGTKQYCVNIGMGRDTFGWRSRSRTYLPAKPVKQLRYMMIYRKNKGKVHFRNPYLGQGLALSSGSRKEKQTFVSQKLTVKDRHLDTFLVKDGKAVSAIVGDAELAKPLVDVIKDKTGVVVPVLDHQSYGDAEVLDRNVIVLGNRDRNRSMSNLYNRHYALLDAKYPGVGGSEVRSLHNPFGDHHNVILCGGSDVTGDRAAVAKLVKRLSCLAAGPSLKLGFMSDCTLSPSYKIARHVKDIPLWEESFGYGNQGFFGWNSLAKNLAMLYITNDSYYKDEFLRLAFPQDKATRDELFELDDEAYHDRRNPIVTVYHYRGAFMTLYWDLVDENPLFTDDERLKVAQALQDQLVHRLTQNGYVNPMGRYGKAGLVRPDRHATWEALLTWTTSRYLDKDYPSAATKKGLEVGRNAMEPLFTHTLNGEIPLFWLTTSIELQFYYGSLQGHRVVGHPRMKDYARCLTVMSDLTEGNKDRTGMYSSQWSLLAAAYLAQDQGLIQLAELKRKPAKGVFAAKKCFDATVFRLGQSFWPVKPYKDNSIVEALGAWNSYANCIPENPEKSRILYTSYRSHADKTGDFLMVDPHYALGVREPQHNFSLVWATIKGTPLLRGFENALIPIADGLTDLTQPMDGEIVGQGVSGEFVWVTGKVADLNGFDWQRTWLLRKQRYLVAIDCLTAKREMKFARFDNRLSAGPDGGGMKRLKQGDCIGTTALGNMVWSCSEPADVTINQRKWSTYLGTDIATFAINRKGVRKGERFRFATVVRLGKTTDLPSAARKDHKIGLLTPNPALLTLTDDGFALESATERFSLRGQVGEAGKGRPEVEAEALAILKGKTVVPASVVNFASKPLNKEWEQKVPGVAGALCIGDQQLLVSSGNQVSCLDGRTGKKLFARDLQAEVSALCYVHERKMWVVGSKNELVSGLDASGNERWKFTSVMAPEMEFLGPYHHKSAVPGIRSLGVTNGKIYVGSAGTLEILDVEGKLIKRSYVQYGAVDEQIPVPETQDVILRRHIGGWPQVHLVTPDLKIRMIGWNWGLRDDLGRFGFSQVNMESVNYFKNSQKEWQVATLFCGVQNRLVVRNTEGKALYEVNFGGGNSATNISHLLGRRAMQMRSIHDVAICDVNGDGKPEIMAGHDNHALYVFDETLKLLELVTIPQVPRKIIAGQGAFWIGQDKGQLLRVGADLIPTVAAQLPDTVLDMKLVGETLLVSCADGTVCAFSVK